MALGKFDMGIITEAVVCNLKFSLDSIKEASRCINDAESCCKVGFRNPYIRTHMEKIDIIKKALKELEDEVSKQLELERKYE
jgi:hypothetical protein